MKYDEVQPKRRPQQVTERRGGGPCSVLLRAVKYAERSSVHGQDSWTTDTHEDSRRLAIQCMRFSPCFCDSRMLVWKRSCSIWTIALMLMTWASCGVAGCNCKEAARSTPKTLGRTARSTVEIPTAEKLANKLGINPKADGHWRQEQKQEDGSVRGRYGYMESNGLTKVVEYFADESGFHILHVKTQAPKHHVDSDVHHDTFSPFLGVVPPFIANTRPQNQPADIIDFPVNEI